MKMQMSVEEQTEIMVKAMMLNDSDDDRSPLLSNEVEDQAPGLTTEVRVELDPAGIFRVPLVWMMSDSCIDLYILTQEEEKDDSEQDLLELFRDISQKFSGCVGDTSLGQEIESKLIELNDDIYSSVDV